MNENIYNSVKNQYVNMLENLSKILHKAEKHAEDHKIDAKIFLDARLHPTMFALTRQIQIATDSARNGMTRLAGLEIISVPDTESSFAELQARISKTIEILKSISPDALGQAGTRHIVVPVRGNNMEFTGEEFLLTFSQPNFYFHLTTAYAILRHNGVDLGKMDFLKGQ